MPKKYKDAAYLHFQEVEQGIADASSQVQAERMDKVLKEYEFQQHLDYIFLEDKSASQIQRAFRKHLIHQQIPSLSKRIENSLVHEAELSKDWNVNADAQLTSEYEFRCDYLPTKRVNSQLHLFNDYHPPLRSSFQKTKQSRTNRNLQFLKVDNYLDGCEQRPNQINFTAMKTNTSDIKPLRIDRPFAKHGFFSPATCNGQVNPDKYFFITPSRRIT